jgi:hypothetical protein
MGSTAMRTLETSVTAFGPADIGRMAEAYQQTLRLINPLKRNDPLAEVIARKVMEIVREGETDPLEIALHAISRLALLPSRQDASI